VTDAIAELKTALEGEDNDVVKAAVEKVNTTSAALGQAMYAAAQSAQSTQSEAPAEDGAGTDGARGSDDDVVDAEIVDDDQNAENK